MKYADTPTYDYETEQERLRRMMKIAEALQMSGMTPDGGTEFTPGPYSYAVKKSPLEPLAKIAQAYMGTKQVKNITDEQRELGQRYAADLRQGMEKFFNTSQGGITNSAGTDAPSQWYDDVAVQKADPRKAVIEALGSNHPVLRQLGMLQMEKMGKDGLTAKDVLPYADPASIPSMVTGGVAGFKPKKNIGEVGGVVYDKDTMQVLELKGGYDPKQVIEINKDTYQVNPSTRKLEKMDNAPKITNNVGGATVINKGQAKGAETVFSERGKTVEELNKIARNAQGMKQSLSEMKALDSQGIFSNVTSGPATFLSNLGQIAGVPVDVNKLSNTEAYNSQAKDLWQGMIAKYGGNRNVTQTEATELKQLVPQATHSPEARQKLYSILERIADRQIEQATRSHKNFMEAVQADDPRLLEPLLLEAAQPQPTQPQPTQPSQGVMSLDDYYNRVTGRKGR